MMKNTMYRIGLGVALALALPALSQAAPENDNHLCYKLKDTNGVDATAAAQFAGFLNCNIKVKAAMICIARDRDGGDDVRGGVLGTTICLKLKCEDTMATLTSATLDTQYGTFGGTIDVDKPKMVCLPVGSDL